MGIGIDTLTKSLYILVGLTRLHGLESTSPYAAKWFVSITVLLGILTFLLVRLPVPKTVPACLFLLMQIMSIFKEYDDLERVKEAPVLIGCVVLFGMAMYWLSRSFDIRRDGGIDGVVVTKEYIASREEEDDAENS